jgi:hypothetical protein
MLDFPVGATVSEGSLVQAGLVQSLADRKRLSPSFQRPKKVTLHRWKCMQLGPSFGLLLASKARTAVPTFRIDTLRACSRPKASVPSLGFQASEFLLVEEIVRKLPMQFAQDELRISVVVPSQSCHGEQQFRERLEEVTSLGS